MVLSLAIDPKSGMGTGTFHGELKLADMKQAAKELWAAPDFARKAVLWDLRDASFALTTDEMAAGDRLSALIKLLRALCPCSRTYRNTASRLS